MNIKYRNSRKECNCIMPIFDRHNLSNYSDDKKWYCKACSGYFSENVNSKLNKGLETGDHIINEKGLTLMYLGPKSGCIIIDKDGFFVKEIKSPSQELLKTFLMYVAKRSRYVSINLEI